MRILFVCYGNICRSPMAEGMCAKKAPRDGFVLDSAGISDWHRDNPPDARAQKICAKHGIDISTQKSRPVVVEDFEDFHLILAMDRSNLAALEAMKPKSSKAIVKLFLDYAEGLDIDEVPDPYNDTIEGFSNVLAMIENATRGLLKTLDGSAAQQSVSH